MFFGFVLPGYEFVPDLERSGSDRPAELVDGDSPSTAPGLSPVWTVEESQTAGPHPAGPQRDA